MLHGALRGRDGDASMGESRARSSAWWSVGCGLLWVGGLLSFAAILLAVGALVGLRSAAVRGAPVLAACAGLVLGVAGIVLSVLIYI